MGYLRLEADGLATFPLEDSEGFDVEQVDLGFPTIRAVTDSHANTDGETDLTAYIGARAVVLSGVIVPTETATRQEVLDRLRAFLNPKLRPYLVYVLDDGVPERRIRLRADQHSAPIERPGFAQVTVGWRGPDGVQESTTLTSDVATATPAVEPGRSYPRTYVLSYPASSPIGSITINNHGNVAVYPVLYLYGPATDPRVENITGGGSLEFAGLTLGDGDYLQIDTRERTILLNGMSTASRYSLLNFAASAWAGLELAPGNNLIRYFPVTYGAGAKAIIRYRTAWI